MTEIEIRALAMQLAVRMTLENRAYDVFEMAKAIELYIVTGSPSGFAPASDDGQ